MEMGLPIEVTNLSQDIIEARGGRVGPAGNQTSPRVRAARAGDISAQASGVFAQIKPTSSS